LVSYHQYPELEIFKAENDLLSFPRQHRRQATLNDTIKAKQKLIAQGYITTEQFMGQAIYWACKSSNKKLQILWEQKRSEEIEALEKSLYDNEVDSD